MSYISPMEETLEREIIDTIISNNEHMMETIKYILNN